MAGIVTIPDPRAPIPLEPSTSYGIAPVQVQSEEPIGLNLPDVGGIAKNFLPDSFNPLGSFPGANFPIYAPGSGFFPAADAAISTGTLLGDQVATVGAVAEGAGAGAAGIGSLGGILGGAGAGFGAGMLINQLAGGSKVSGTIGSGVGALSGAIIGSIIPGIGTLIGGLIGGAAGGGIGGLFGRKPNGPPESKAGIGSWASFAKTPEDVARIQQQGGDPSRQDIGVIHNSSANAGKNDQGRSLADQVMSNFNKIQKSLGGTASFPGSIGIGFKKDSFYVNPLSETMTSGDPTGQQKYGNAKEAINAATMHLVKNANWGGLSEPVTNAIRNSQASTINQLITDVRKSAPKSGSGKVTVSYGYGAEQVLA